MSLLRSGNIKTTLNSNVWRYNIQCISLLRAFTVCLTEAKCARACGMREHTDSQCIQHRSGSSIDIRHLRWSQRYLYKASLFCKMPPPLQPQSYCNSLSLLFSLSLSLSLSLSFDLLTHLCPVFPSCNVQMARRRWVLPGWTTEHRDMPTLADQW